MALIKCPECEKEVSDISEVCIHCGYPIGKDNLKKKCLECGTLIEDGSDVCSNCASKLSNKEDVVVDKNNSDYKEVIQTDNIKSSNKGLMIGIICGTLGLIITIFIFVTMNQVEIPDLYNVSQSTAETILSSNGLIPSIEYKYDDYVLEGNVIETSPYAYTKIKENSSVIVYVSKGPSYIKSKDSTLSWYNINPYEEDDWSFYAPYIEEGYLYIECKAVFSKSFDWYAPYGEAFGEASINDSFDKKIPLQVITDDLSVESDTEHSFTLKMSIDDLDVKKTTTLYTNLIADDDGEQFKISTEFTISW